MKYVFLSFLLCYNVFAEPQASYEDLCGEMKTHCITKPNRVYFGYGSININSIKQDSYSFGYQRGIQTKGGDVLIIGVQGIGTDKSGLLTTQLTLGMDF